MKSVHPIALAGLLSLAISSAAAQDDSPNPAVGPDYAPPAVPGVQLGTGTDLPAWAQPNLTRKVPRILTEDEIRESLQSQGYYDIRDLHRDGDHFTAQARQYGKKVTLTIDPSNGGAVQVPD